MEAPARLISSPGFDLILHLGSRQSNEPGALVDLTLHQVHPHFPGGQPRDTHQPLAAVQRLRSQLCGRRNPLQLVQMIRKKNALIRSPALPAIRTRAAPNQTPECCFIRQDFAYPTSRDCPQGTQGLSKLPAQEEGFDSMLSDSQTRPSSSLLPAPTWHLPAASWAAPGHAHLLATSCPSLQVRLYIHVGSRGVSRAEEVGGGAPGLSPRPSDLE